MSSMNMYILVNKFISRLIARHHEEAIVIRSERYENDVLTRPHAMLNASEDGQ